MPSRTAEPQRPNGWTIHRDTLARTKAAVTVWASIAQNRTVAASILELLAPCARDTDGDTTLDSIASIFEEHQDLPVSLLQRLSALTDAAHALAKEAR